MTAWYQQYPFSTVALSADDALPSLSLIALDNWTFTVATGQDAVSYLQGQLTCDLVSLGKQNSTLAAHCDAKGKVWSILRLWHHGEGIAIAQPSSIAEKQLGEIKKYAIFSKIAFEQTEHLLLGLVGERADAEINAIFPGEGDVRVTQSGTVVKVGTNQWMLALDAKEADSLVSNLEGKAVLSDATLWDLYDIRQVLPKVEEATTNEFIPQSLNLQALDAISFKKGCYTGQETVARAKYRGINKRATYRLSGKAVAIPKPGDTIERSVGENWRSGGTVISGYLFADGSAEVLAVLPNNLDDDTHFRLAEHPDSLWQRQTLPYSLDD